MKTYKALMLAHLKEFLLQDLILAAHNVVRSSFNKSSTIDSFEKYSMLDIKILRFPDIFELFDIFKII